MVPDRASGPLEWEEEARSGNIRLWGLCGGLLCNAGNLKTAEDTKVASMQRKWVSVRLFLLME